MSERRFRSVTGGSAGSLQTAASADKVFSNRKPLGSFLFPLLLPELGVFKISAPRHASYSVQAVSSV